MITGIQWTAFYWVSAGLLYGGDETTPTGQEGALDSTRITVGLAEPTYLSSAETRDMPRPDGC